MWSSRAFNLGERQTLLQESVQLVKNTENVATQMVNAGRDSFYGFIVLAKIGPALAPDCCELDGCANGRLRPLVRRGPEW